MRTKHPAKDPGSSSGGGGSSSDPILSPFGELRKSTEPRYVSARGKSKCASVRESSRSGGSTPRRASESPSPKLTREITDSDTPRTYLIKDSFCEPDVKLAELTSVQPCKQPCNRYLSEIDELDWFYDQERSKGGGETSCSSEVINLKELLKGKAPQVAEKVAGKGPMAFPTEFTEGLNRVEGGGEMPPWLQNAYKSLTRLDDEDDEEEDEERAEVSRESSGASCSARKESSDEGSEAEVARGGSKEGAGWLWKMSMCASVSFVTWVLMNGARIQCRSLFPTIREREQPAKIVRRDKSSKGRGGAAAAAEEQHKFC